jgi:hypothetical protein
MNDAPLTHSLPSVAHRSRWLQTAPLGLVLALSLAGCEVRAYSDRDDYYEDEGSLSIDWTLDDTRDPRACDDYDAYDLELILYDDRGSVASRLSPACDDFGLTIDLLDGVYSLDATLVDRSGHSVSTTLKLDDIDVYAGEDTPISIDFPQDSRR